MTHSPSLQSMQAAAQRPGCFRLHTEASNHISFPGAIAILANSSKRNAHNSILILKLRNEIDVKWIGSFVKNNEPFAVMFDLADGSGHRENAL